MNKCDNCPYNYWDTDNNGVSVGHAHCHFTGPDEWAPCNETEYYEEDNDEEDYYEGR